MQSQTSSAFRLRPQPFNATERTHWGCCILHWSKQCLIAPVNGSVFCLALSLIQILHTSTSLSIILLQHFIDSDALTKSRSAPVCNSMAGLVRSILSPKENGNNNLLPTRLDHWNSRNARPAWELPYPLFVRSVFPPI